MHHIYDSMSVKYHESGELLKTQNVYTLAAGETQLLI